MKTYLPFILVFLLGSCAYSGSYNASFIPQSISYANSEKLSGKGLIYMSEEEESYIFSGSPTSLTGAATSLKLPLGNYSKQIALKVYSELFTDGVSFSNNLEDSQNYTLSISPKVTDFSFAYNSASSLGFAVTPEAKISLKVTVYNKNGSKVFEKSYSPPKLDGDSYMFSANPDEKVNQAAHRLIANISEESMKDIKRELTE